MIQILASNSQGLKKFQWLEWKTFTHYKSLSDAEEFILQIVFKTTVNTSSAGITNNCRNMLDYVRSSANRDADKETVQNINKKIGPDFSHIFTGISCFNGTFKLQVREDSN